MSSSSEPPPNVTAATTDAPTTQARDAATLSVRSGARSTGRERLLLIAKLLAILACLYLFIVGIGMMGHSVKLFGTGFSEQILKTTASPFVGLFIGLLATAIVQSSSTTTSIIVSMVAGGAISVAGAIPMIMGANIGTTITNTLVSLAHIRQSADFRRAFAAATIHDFFNLLTVLALFPLELATGFLAKSATVLANLFQGVGGMRIADPLKLATKPAIDALSALVSHSPWLLLILSVLLIWPVPRIRAVPLRLAEGLAEISQRSRLIPLLYILLVFFLLPLGLILLFR